MPKNPSQPGLFGPIAPRPPSGQSAVAPGQAWVTSDHARLVRIAFESGGDNLYDYALPDDLADQVHLGQRIAAPFGRGNRVQTGFCVDFPPATDVTRVKVVARIIDPHPLLDTQMLDLARWIAQYYCCPLGQVLSAMVPAAVKRRVGIRKKAYIRILSDPSPEDVSHRLSRQGRTILDFLTHNAHPEGLDLKQLAAQLNCGRGPFSTLARAGLVEIIERTELDAPPISAAPGLVGPKPVELNADQQAALKTLHKLIDEKTFNAVLLHGVTASGKTEVYIRAIEKVIQQGAAALVLVPEIALTPQTISRFHQCFSQVAVMHSQLTASQRHQQWQNIAQGLPQVVVGTRSAVFAPLPRLGIIIVDEEHEPSYKQDNTPRYHGRDISVKRAQINNIPIILGSATPSLETFHNCQTKTHYHHIQLPRRVLNLPLPRVRIVNMQTEMLERKGAHLFSRVLEHELNNCLTASRQAIILLNRRGHSSYLFCSSCKFVLNCPNCAVSLTLHRRKDKPDQTRRYVMCHYCQHRTQLPKLCPLCSRKLLRVGPGTQKAEDELIRKIPRARLQRVDSDSMRRDDYESVLTDFAAGRLDILLGTQMIGKGLDFPNVALVGVLSADTALSLPDFRSSERTFQLLTQVAGRCGRADNVGKVIVQTFLPDDPAIDFACRHDYQAFADQELQLRRACKMPPYARLARIVLSHAKLQTLETASRRLRTSIDQLPHSLRESIAIRGPLPAPLAYLENYHRQEIVFAAATPDPIQRLLAQVRQSILPTLNVRTAVDVDPINLM